MSKLKPFTILLFLTIISLFLFLPFSEASDQLTIYINNRPVYSDTPSFIYNGRVYVPLRFISENLGAEVSYVSLDNSVRINFVDYRAFWKNLVKQKSDFLDCVDAAFYLIVKSALENFDTQLLGGAALLGMACYKAVEVELINLYPPSEYLPLVVAMREEAKAHVTLAEMLAKASVGRNLSRTEIEAILKNALAAVQKRQSMVANFLR